MTTALASAETTGPFAFSGERPSARAERRLPEQPWFETPDLERRLHDSGADDATRAFARELAENGLARIDLGDEGRALCEAVRAEVEPVFEDPRVQRVQDAWLRSETVRRLATLPAVVERLSLAYGRRAFPFQTLNFKRGTQQDLHSDAMHFHTDPPLFMAGVWIALEDIQPDSGPLTYVPGSHRLPVLTMRGAGVDSAHPTRDDYNRAYTPALKAQIEAAGLKPAEVTPKAGEAVVWAANLAHGGAPIANPGATRRSLVVHFYFEGCVYYTPMYSDVEGGRLAVRLPANVATGGWVWPCRGARPAAPEFTAFLGACRKLLLRQPIVTRSQA